MASTRKARKPDKKHPIVVIGGGPAGMTAAQTAAANCNSVILFDKNPEPGKKLRSLSSGPLFISENLPREKIARAFGEKEKFIFPALKEFGPNELSNHLAAMDIKLTSNGNSHMVIGFGMGPQLPSKLVEAAIAAGVSIRKSSKVSDIIFNKNLASAVVVNSVEYPVSSVIVACGSVASPARGATDDGYQFARKAGHTIAPTLPAMVGLETEERYGKSLTGAEFADCIVQVTRDDELQFSDRGGLIFTGYGLEGNLILTHSAKIIDLLGRENGKKHKVEIHIDMMPNIKKKDLESWFDQRISGSPKITVGAVFEAFIPEKLRGVMNKVVRIHSDKPVANLSHLEKKVLLLWVKDFHLTIKRPRPFNETKGVLGGVSIDEIDPLTMRSLKIKNLYFAGEVLDLLGPWGGFNFQMAFSTGYLAGLSASKAHSD
jgi:hypothetical protein